MKAIIFLSAFMIAANFVQAQTIIGTWQLVKETNCLEEIMEPLDSGVDKVAADMARMSTRTPQVIQFKDNNTGSESIRIIDQRKASGTSNFLYKLNENSLYILDKKSHTIKEAFAIEKLTADSLIISNPSRPCEVKIFLKIK